MHILKVKIENTLKTIRFDAPTNLSQLLIDNNLYIDRPCGGVGTCGKCKIQFTQGIPTANKYDTSILTTDEIIKGYRLACKCTIDEDCSIILLQKESMKIKESGLSTKNSISLSDDIMQKKYGIAVDLGTTTVVVYLINLLDGNLIDAKSTINPQKKYGDNVITRCEYIHTNEDGLNTLHILSIECINNLTDSLCQKNNIDNIDISRVVISGNTIMQHILLNVDPYPIAIAPFTPEFIELKKVLATDINLHVASNAFCYISNSISGYVGGDIVSGIMAVGMDASKGTSLLVDIGTNGEIVLRTYGKMYACSVAAGPAFEGAHISCGVGGIDGAINKAYIANGKISFATISDAKPIGICGSGLVDIIACLLNENIIDETGALDTDKCTNLNDEIVYQITKDIYISQSDIREVQLAKSAVAAGIEVLLKKAGINFDDVDEVYLAGGFGSYLDINSAVDIKLIHKSLLNKCSSVGNTAGMGSIKSLLSDIVLQSLKLVSKSVEYIELSFDPDFNNLFIDNMLF